MGGSQKRRQSTPHTHQGNTKNSSVITDSNLLEEQLGFQRRAVANIKPPLDLGDIANHNRLISSGIWRRCLLKGLYIFCVSIKSTRANSDNNPHVIDDEEQWSCSKQRQQQQQQPPCEAGFRGQYRKRQRAIQELFSPTETRAPDIIYTFV